MLERFDHLPSTSLTEPADVNRPSRFCWTLACLSAPLALTVRQRLVSNPPLEKEVVPDLILTSRNILGLSYRKTLRNSRYRHHSDHPGQKGAINSPRNDENTQKSRKNSLPVIYWPYKPGEGVHVQNPDFAEFRQSPVKTSFCL